MTIRVLAVFALVGALSSGARSAAADDPKLPDVKVFDKLVIDSLRDVHNKGADLYNTSKDFVGSYRVYQGALMAVRPLLAHRPEAQKLIDDGLTAAEKESDAARKAFLLHEAIEAVRKHLKTAIAAPKPADPPEKEPKKPEPPVAPMPKEAKPKEPPPVITAIVTGSVKLNGKPLAGGEVIFTEINVKQSKVVKAKIDEAGAYKSDAALPVGKYNVTVTGTGVPDKYKTAETSGLVVELKAGANALDFELK
jgi:hypothetical protein